MRKTIIAPVATVVAAQMLVAAAVAATAQTVPAPAPVQTAPVTVPAQTDTENIFRYRVGDAEVVLLSDGHLDEDTRGILNAPDELIAPYLSEAGTYPSAINAFAVVTPREVVLIDAGGSGKVAENLRAAGIGEPDEIYLTHMHWDHVGGLLTGGERVFPGAVLSLSEREAGYWAAQNGDEKKVLDACRFRTVEPFALGEVPDGEDGIFPIAAYGHTPGHTIYLVVSKGEKLLIWGDVVHAPAVQMPLPEISMRWDVDPDAARTTRLEVLEYVVKNKIPVAGAHIAYPGMGFVGKAAKGYEFTPVY